MFTSGAQAAKMIFDKTDSMPGRKTDVEFMVPFDGPVMALFRSLAIVGAPLFGSEMFKFQADPGNPPVDVHKAAGGGSALSIPRLSDLGLSKLKVSDEPVPTIALLILVGLIALIALKGRRR
jgi:hypothetical protein